MPAAGGSDSRSNIVLEPIGGKIDADLSVVDRSRFGAAFLGGEYFDRLVGRADSIIQLLRILDGHNAVITAMGYQEGAGESLRENFFAISMPSSSFFAPATQRHWKLDCATDF